MNLRHRSQQDTQEQNVSVFVSVGEGRWRKGGSQWTVEPGLPTAATHHQRHTQDATGYTHKHTRS